MTNRQEEYAEDFRAELQAYGRDPAEFSITYADEPLDPTPGPQSFRTWVTVRHVRSGVSRRYESGGFHESWVGEFAYDFADGVWS